MHIPISIYLCMLLFISLLHDFNNYGSYSYQNHVIILKVYSKYYFNYPKL